MIKNKKIFMSGIGGVGMSALAQLLKGVGNEVIGSDVEASPTTDLLGKKGVRVIIGQKKENVPKDANIFIYSSAVPKNNPERKVAKNLGIKELSYFETLGELSKESFTIAISGSHGKTTTTAITAKILKDGGENPTAIVGSIVNDFKSNFLAGKDDLLVVEACEYKDNFLNIKPDILVITNIELDHTDYFKSLESLLESFKTLVKKIPKKGALVANLSDKNVSEIIKVARCPVIDYTKESVPELILLGEFNKMNAKAAKAAAKTAYPRLEEKVINNSLKNFKGTWRRFEFKGKNKNGVEVYDDYAHHPTEIKKTLEAVGKKFKKKEVVVAFQPHLYSRTKDMMPEMAESLKMANEVIVAPVYAARENPIENVTNESLAEIIPGAKTAESLKEVSEILKEKNGNKIIITMGAGDIYRAGEKVVENNQS